MSVKYGPEEFCYDESRKENGIEHEVALVIDEYITNNDPTKCKPTDCKCDNGHEQNEVA